MIRFRSTPSSVLVTSDVSARGLDIPNVDHVIHYQLPRTPDLYIHRSGRTARGTTGGISVALCGPGEIKAYKRICHALGREDGVEDFPVDFSIMKELKERIEIAREIDEVEHQLQKVFYNQFSELF